MKKYLILFIAAVSTTFFVGCDSEDEFTPANYITFETGPANVQVDLGGSTTHDITVYTSNVVGSDRTFDVVVRDASTIGSEAYSLPATVTIPAGTNEGVLTLDLQDMNINPNGESLVLGIEPAEDDQYVGSDLTVNVSLACDPQLALDFTFDDYASEISWEVTDSEGNVRLEGGGYTDGTASTSVERCLPEGEYTFTVSDSYGDGIEDGSIIISYGGEEVVNIPGDFGLETSVPFTLGAGSGDGGTDGGETDGGEGEGEGDGSEDGGDDSGEDGEDS